MKTLLLDRDGVINHESSGFIRSPSDWQPLPDSLDAIVRAQHAGFRIVVLSNQSGLGRGLLGIVDLNAIHRLLQARLERLGGRVDAFFFCPHLPDEGCTCRKPKAGLLEMVGHRLGIPLTNVPFIGDRSTDAEAARRAGARPILVRTGIRPLPACENATETFDNLGLAVDALVAEAQGARG